MVGRVNTHSDYGLFVLASYRPNEGCVWGVKLIRLVHKMKTTLGKIV